jgi:ParB family chromosome partitioning protein
METTKANIKDIAVGRSDLFRLKPEDLHIKDGWNSRDDQDPDNRAHIESLALSIADCGVKQPLTAFQEAGKFYLSDGHCRLAAVRLAMSRGAEIKSVPVILEDRFSTEADRVFSQVLKNGGKPLAPLEQARVFKRLLDLGWSVEEVATKAGKGKQQVLNLLELNTAPAEITDLVRRGEVSASLASSTLKKHRANAGDVLKEAVKTAKASGKAKATPKHVAPAKTITPAVGAFEAALAKWTKDAPVGADLEAFRAGWDAAKASR